MQVNHHRVGATAFGRTVLAAAALATAGCSSPLTTVALREFLRESTMTLAVDSDVEDDAAERASKPDDDEAKVEAEKPDARIADAGSDGEDDAAVEDLPLEQKIERSLERLARTSGLDPVARDVLVDTLEKAAREDWPDIIDSFTSSLEASPPRSPSNESAATSRGEHSANHASKTVGGLTSPVAASVPDEVQPAVHEEPVAVETQEAPAEPEPAQDPEEIVAMLKERLAEARRNAPLTVRRACFASKVRGWGNLDAFDESRFVPGQDVLVYVELDNLDGLETPKGFSTRVEARLRLLNASGGVVEEWSFPLVEDRADSPRTDYFVRYLVRIPADANAGPHRLEAAITDAVSSKTVATELALEVVADGSDRAR